MLPSTLNVVGRIGFKEVWPYLEKIKLAQNKVKMTDRGDSLCFELVNSKNLIYVRSTYMALILQYLCTSLCSLVC